MPQINVTAATVINEADLAATTPVLTDTVHLTRGRKATLTDIKTALLAGESTAVTDVNVPTPTATAVTVQAITGATTNSSTIPSATTTTAGVLSAADKIKLDTIPTGGIDGSETKLSNGTNISITGLGTIASPYVINSSGGGGSSNFRGTFSTLALLTSGVASPVAGDYADVDTNGTFSTRYIWDTTDSIWTTGVGENALNHQFVIDEDSFVSDSDTKVPTQQSVKAYVDNSIASASGGDMTKAIYDTGDNGIVDNSENLEGNDSAYHLNRANHTGTQAASTISNFDAEVANNAAVVANTAKVTASGSVTTHNDVTSAGSGQIITDAERIAFGNAEPNVQSDWNATTGDALILNKPTTITSAQAASIVTNTAKIGVSASSVNNVGAVMETDTTTAGMAFVIDEDDMSSNSATRIPTQQSVKAYVDANAGTTPYIRQTLASKVKVLAKASTVTYAEVSGTGTLTIAEFGDITHASIPLTQGVSYPVDGDFTLNIVFSDNSVNTWEPVANNAADVNNQDIYVPKIEAYGYNLPFFLGTKELNQLNIGNTPVVPSSITWNAGTLSLTYTDSSSFGGNDRIILNIDFPKK